MQSPQTAPLARLLLLVQETSHPSLVFYVPVRYGDIRAMLDEMMADGLADERTEPIEMAAVRELGDPDDFRASDRLLLEGAMPASMEHATDRLVRSTERDGRGSRMRWSAQSREAASIQAARHRDGAREVTLESWPVFPALLNLGAIALAPAPEVAAAFHRYAAITEWKALRLVASGLYLEGPEGRTFVRDISPLLGVDDIEPFLSSEDPRTRQTAITLLSQVRGRQHSLRDDTGAPHVR